MFTKSYWTEKKHENRNINFTISLEQNLRKTFSKLDTTNWSYNLYETTETVNDTIPTYKVNQTPRIYNKDLLKKSELSMNVDDSVMKKLTVS